MKAFFKRWPGTTGMVALFLLGGVMGGASWLLRKAGLSGEWVFVPVFILLFVGMWKTDRELQRLRRNEWEEK